MLVPTSGKTGARTPATRVSHEIEMNASNDQPRTWAALPRNAAQCRGVAPSSRDATSSAVPLLDDPVPCMMHRPGLPPLAPAIEPRATLVQPSANYRQSRMNLMFAAPAMAITWAGWMVMQVERGRQTYHEENRALKNNLMLSSDQKRAFNLQRVPQHTAPHSLPLALFANDEVNVYENRQVTQTPGAARQEVLPPDHQMHSSKARTQSKQGNNQTS